MPSTEEANHHRLNRRVAALPTKPCDTLRMSHARAFLLVTALLGACGHPAMPTVSAGPGRATSPSPKAPGAQSDSIHEPSPGAKNNQPSVAWESAVDESTRKAVTVILERMWGGAMSSYMFSSTAVDPTAPIEGKAQPRRFPGDKRSHWTLDCCKPSLDCNDAPRWKEEPLWSSLNFSPPEYDQRMRFDFRSIGTAREAQFLAVVAVDPKCDGHPIYFWRRGTIDEKDEVIGSSHPVAGDRPPAFELSPRN